jgi:hypothetical protein
MAASPFEQIVQPKLLVGEGQDEVRFFESLLRHLKLTDIQVVGYGGKQRLKQFITTLPRIPGFAGLQALGITRDADDDARGALQGLDSAIAAAALPAELRIATHVLPGANSPGALESLCIQAISNLPISDCIEKYVLCASKSGLKQQWSVGNAAKARLQAWLSMQQEPGLRLGEAAQAGIVDWEAASLAGLRDFIVNL